MERNFLTIAVVGAGYAARLHGAAYKRVYSIQPILKWIIDPDMQKAEKVQRQFNFQKTAADINVALEDPEVDVIDICTPPVCHRDMIISALHAGKHVICEKPLLGYFGEAGDPEPIGLKVQKGKMYHKVIEDMAILKK